jgi:tetratricopeptide (TPR) repeat protein
MARAVLSGLAMCLVACPVWAQVDRLSDRHPDNRTVLGGGDEYLMAGADAIRAGRYEDGIRLTSIGLERAPRAIDRAAALSNLCAAHAAKGEADRAIAYCSESLTFNDRNWRAYSNRSYAYYLKGMFSEATFDLDAAAAINPSAKQVLQIKGMINERSLQPRVIMEDHQ